MLRFRPIAPKPIANESFSGNLPSENPDLNINTRKKRKYVRNITKSKQHKRNSKTSGAASGRQNNKRKAVVTLQLLPEKSTGNKSTATLSSSFSSDHDSVSFNVQDQTTWLNITQPIKQMVSDLDRAVLVFSVSGSNKSNNKAQQTGQTDLRWFNDNISTTPKLVIESWVTVDCMTGTCIEGEKLDCSDNEIILNLETATSPSFISNGYNNKVKWINEAYREMIIRHYGDGTIKEHELFASLIIKENEFPYHLHWAFTCRVKVEYECGNMKGTIIMPCDTWRMESGDFAWKLDLCAALSLGR